MQASLRAAVEGQVDSQHVGTQGLERLLQLT